MFKKIWNFHDRQIKKYGYRATYLTGERLEIWRRQTMFNARAGLAIGIILSIGWYATVNTSYNETYGKWLWPFILMVGLVRYAYLVATKQSLLQLKRAESRASKAKVEDSYQELQNLAETLKVKHGKN